MLMSEQVSLEYMPVLLARSVMSYCGLLAVCLGAIGLYSVLAFAVRTRTREIGIRMALGARREDVTQMILRQGLVLALVGIVFGVAAALLLTKLEASLLYGCEMINQSSTRPLQLRFFCVLLEHAFCPPAARRRLIQPKHCDPNRSSLMDWLPQSVLPPSPLRRTR